LLTFLFKVFVFIVLAFAVISLALVFTDKRGSADGDTLDFSRESGVEAISPEHSFVARDGTRLPYHQFGDDTGPLIVLIHGSSAHGGLYQALGEGLANFGTVIVPDLRGHGGQTPVGDVNYIGQLEDDLADLVAATRSSEDQKVIFVGHSSGGGLLVRYAGNPRQTPADAVVLLSPYLGFNAPTMREDAGGWAQPLTRRILGLTLLNAVHG